MDLDVVIPTRRPDFIQTTLYSLSKNSVKPDYVTIVSNEVSEGINCYGLNVRLIRFQTNYYPIGDCDVVLRRNIGIWASKCSHVLTFDDDQIAPVNMIEKSIDILKKRPYFWGHHRFLDFSFYPIDDIIKLPPEKGRTREHPANSWPMWLSCYAGLFGAEKDLVERVGGFDMAFLGRHVDEDQNLGRRIAREVDQSERVFIYEPPFAWHPEKKIPWAPSNSNVCSKSHEFSRAVIGPLELEKCANCPYFRVINTTINSIEVVMRFNPEYMATQELMLPIMEGVN